MQVSPFQLFAVDEQARLATLSEYDISHSLREPVFHDVVTLVTSVFQAPVSLIGLIEAEQVNYRAAWGLAGARTQPRHEALCALVIERNRPVVFTDLTQSNQYQQLTASARSNVVRQRYQFYAGVPLRMPNQHVLGTLCVLDRRPRQLQLAELRSLEIIASLVERLIVVRYACLSHTWLGHGSWRATYQYVSTELRTLLALIQELNAARPWMGSVDTAVLDAVIRHLNMLSLVLAEPLPNQA